MKIKQLLLLFSVFLIYACDDEQAASPGNADTFIKFFGASNADISYDAKPTSDGGYILLGTTEINDDDQPAKKIRIVKVDKNGNTDWNRLYPSFDTENHLETSFIGRTILVVDDGYIVVGDSMKTDGTTQSSLLLMKISSTPTDNTYDHIAIDYRNGLGITNDDRSLMGMDAMIDSDGNIRVISNVMENGESVGVWSSNISSNLSFDVNDDCSYVDFDVKLEVFKSLSESADGSLAFGGHKSIKDFNNPVPNFGHGQKCSRNYFGSDNLISSNENFIASQVIPTSNGYAMVGTYAQNENNTDIFFARLNSKGELSIPEPIIFSGDGFGSSEEGLSIANTSDGGFIIAGSTLSNTIGETDMLLLKITATGTIQWSKLHGHANEEYASYVFQDDDGGYMVLDNTEFGGIDTMVLMKTDKNGNVN